MKQTRIGKLVCLAAVFCFAAAVASHGQTFTLLDTFTGKDGLLPNGYLAQGYNGNFYESTGFGGEGQSGNILEITPAGTLSNLYSFSCEDSICPNGNYPIGNLALAPGGHFYGVTFSGTIFDVTPTGKLTTLYSFCTASGCPDGGGPESGLTLGANGNFYGATFFGGTGNGGSGGGTMYEVTPTGTVTTLYNFCVLANCTDGENPHATLVQGTNGSIYGTTYWGGTHNSGTVFEYTPAGKLITLYSIVNTPGATFTAGPLGLVQARDGSIYGFTDYGGKTGNGTIFKISTSGKFSTLYSFCSQTGCLDGTGPIGLLQGPDGNFYGTTAYGGTGIPACLDGLVACGTIFEMTPEGNLTTLYNFCLESGCLDGAAVDPMSLGTDGIFYGTTQSGGSTGDGTIYSFATGLTPFVQANPNFSRVGRAIAILGNGLTGTTSVTINGISATFAVEADTLIKATVPTGATTGTIEVTTTNDTLNSNVAFQVLP
jgi:uncharacterized repeat protein (TIGR03803 family)